MVAHKNRQDRSHKAALDFYEHRQDEKWLWSPWHRIEVFNTIRQLTRDKDPKLRLLKPEAAAMIHSIEEDVRVGYFEHVEADWRDFLRAANRISTAHAFDLRCRAADLLHVAYAAELRAVTFVGFDADQLGLAKAAGMHAVKPKS